MLKAREMACDGEIEAGFQFHDFSRANCGDVVCNSGP